MSDGKPYCEGWLYDYHCTGGGEVLCHLHSPGSVSPSHALCGHLSRDELTTWQTAWGEPNQNQEVYGDICPTCLASYVDRRDGRTLDDLRREALAIVEEELGEVIA